MYFIPIYKTLHLVEMDGHIMLKFLSFFQVIEIPYIDEHLSMFVMLPKARTGLADFESKLTSEKLTVRIK